jgi:hypothetical protein
VSAFDGTGNASEETSFRAGLIMILVMVVLVAGLLLLASGALNAQGADRLDTQVNPPGLLSNPPAS